MAVEEIYISNYFRDYDVEQHTSRDWREINKVRDKINSFKTEGEIYEWLYERRLSLANRAEDERLFGIPNDHVVTPKLHADQRNKYYGIYSDGYKHENEGNKPYKDYCVRKNGHVVVDANGNAKQYGKLAQGLLNFSDRMSGNLHSIANFAKFLAMHAKIVLIAVAVTLGLVVLANLAVYIVGVAGSLGRTPFALCGDGDNKTSVEDYVGDNVNMEENPAYATDDYAMWAFIQQATQNKWSSNATIGAMAWLMQKGIGMGSFTYDHYAIFDGPDGNAASRRMDNEEWLNWIDTSGMSQSHIKVQHANSHDEGLRYAVVGLGLLHEEDIWDFDWVWVYDYTDEEGDEHGYWEERPYKIQSNASKMVLWCENQNRLWNDPVAQADWVIHNLPGGDMWDGADPKVNECSVEEWVKRLVCGYDHPKWKINTKNDEQLDEMQKSIAYIQSATAMYMKWSNKPLDVMSLGGIKRNQCEGLGTIFSGGNASIADAAVSLASGDKTMGDHKIIWDKDGLDSENLNLPQLATYKLVHMNVCFAGDGDPYFASCDRSVSCAVKWAGADDTFPDGATGSQHKYLKKSPKWALVGIWGECNLAPGDVLITPGGGHIKMYVGLEATNRRWPGSTAEYYQGSYHDYFPFCSKDAPEWDPLDRTYEVYRCINPDNSPKYMNAASGGLMNGG